MSARTVETVVTYLRLTEPARTMPPMPSGFRLALMKAEAIPLHYYRYLYRTVGTNWLWFERLLLNDADLSDRLHRDGIEIYVAYANGSPAGYYELDFRNPLSTNLVYFGLVPEFTGMRIGPWLLGSAITEALSRQATQVTVNTCTMDHPAALPLYQRLGFEPTSQDRRRLTVPAHIPIPGHIATWSAP